MSVPASDPGSKCPTCGTSFKPRLDWESNAFQERLLSDYDPAAREEIEAMVSLVDEEYERLQLRLRSLSARQQQLKLCSLKLRSLLSPSPIRKLPNEVLMYIFDHVSQDNLFQEKRDQWPKYLWPKYLWPDDENGLATMPALVLSSVCTRWRQITLSFSALWSRMTLIVNLEEPDSQYTELTATLQLYLDRSGISLLRLRICTIGDSDNKVTHHALSLLGQCSRRWQYLTFIGTNYLVHDIFSFPPDIHRFPMLEELTFDSTTAEALDIFGQVPKLWLLVMEEDSLSPFSGISVFPSWQLTSLAVTYENGFEMIVDYCPNLISLRIRLHHNVDIVHQEPRALRSLKSLSVVITHARVDIGTLGAVLSSFICPALASLMVERQPLMVEPPLASTVKTTWPLQALKNFLSQSSCTLSSLSIKGLQLYSNDLIAVLKRLPSLASLVIEDHRDESETITLSLIQSLYISNSSILRSSSDPSLLPKLQHLSLTHAGKIFDDTRFVNMIESRCLPIMDAERQGIASLRSLVLKFLDRTLDKDVAEIYEPLRKLEDEAGFRLVIVSHEGSYL